MSILITCESGGFRIPSSVAAANTPVRADLASNKTTPIQSPAPVCNKESRSDIALDEADLLARDAAIKLGARLRGPCLLQPFSPAFVDVSRSSGNRRVFGSRGRQLTAETQSRLLDECYHPYWRSVETAVTQILEHFTFVVHLSIHSFAPRRDGRFLRTDVGLLYDSSRDHESDLCTDWIDEVYFEFGNLRVRRNYPTRGDRNALHAHLRQRFPGDQYLGIEVALNRWWAGRRNSRRDEAIDALADCFAATIGLPMPSSTQTNELRHHHPSDVAPAKEHTAEPPPTGEPGD